MYPSCRDIVVQRWRKRKLLESDEYAKEPFSRWRNRKLLESDEYAKEPFGCILVVEISLFKDFFFFVLKCIFISFVLNNY